VGYRGEGERCELNLEGLFKRKKRGGAEKKKETKGF